MIAGRLGAVAAATCCVALTLAGCTGKTTYGPTTYVTVPAPSTTASSSAAPAPSPTTTPTPTVKAMTKLPGPCDSLLPLGSVVNALGRLVHGATAFVVGEPDSSTDRVGYINCRYGLSKATPTPTIEIGVNLYRTAAKAAARIRPTVTDYTEHAATASKTTVEGMPATVLDGGSGTGYGPTIVLAVGQRTIAVSLRPGAVTSAELVKNLVALAALAAERTASG